MNFFEQIIFFLQANMNTPKTFGLFHIICFVLMIIIIALIIIFRNKFTPKTVKYILLFLGLTLIILEILKQLIFSFNYNPTLDTVTWDYQWYAFPFQFCSTPMYIFIIAGLCKPNLFRDCLYSYLATFSLIAGLGVMIYPGDVFTSTIFINIQTMIWHSSMVIIGVLLWSTNSVKIQHSTILKANSVFIIMVCLALLLNFAWKVFGGVETGETFNMFFVSPYYKCHLPILSYIQLHTPYIVFLLSYILGFIALSYLVYLIRLLIYYLSKKINHNTK